MYSNLINEENADRNSSESERANQGFPRAVWFIVGIEFCERFNYFGMRAILIMYLMRTLNYDEAKAVVTFHSFVATMYFMCIVGAIISDSWLGKFRTILLLSLVYIGGDVVLTLGAIPPFNRYNSTMTIAGLLTMAVGFGGIKPCVTAFSCEQFKLPEQARFLAIFFAIAYVVINFVSLLSSLITPILRKYVKCEHEDCFALAFGLPAVLMIIPTLSFIAGKPMYKITAPAGNMLVKVTKCIWTALRTKLTRKDVVSREHWLDYSVEIWGQHLVEDTKILLNVLWLYIPLPVFWALFELKVSRWPSQANRMNWDIGFCVRPDQIPIIYPFLMMVLTVLYRIIFYPLLSKLGIQRPLQILTLGGVFAGTALVISTVVENQIEKTNAVLPKANESQLRIFNGLDCNYTVESDIPNHEIFVLEAKGMFEVNPVPVEGNQSFIFTFTSDYCGNLLHEPLCVEERRQISYFINRRNNGPLNLMRYEDDTTKSFKGCPMVRLLGNTATNQTFDLLDIDSPDPLSGYFKGTFNADLFEAYPSHYKIIVGGESIKEYTLQAGGVYTFIIGDEYHADSTHYWVHPIALTEPNSFSILWLLPQCIVMILGEVMFSISGWEFSYTQAPDSMKTVLQACFQLTHAVGNLVVVIVTEAKFFHELKWEFALFAVLGFVAVGVFAVLAYCYKPIPLRPYDAANARLIDEDDSHDRGSFAQVM